jgi:hypothetical protein
VDHRPVRAPGPARRQSRPIRCRRPGRPNLAPRPRPRPRIEACPANIRAARRAPRSIDGALSASRTPRTPTVMATRGVRSNRAPNVARACSRAASPVFGKAQLRPEIGARQGDNKEENGVGNSERAKCRSWATMTIARTLDKLDIPCALLHDRSHRRVPNSTPVTPPALANIKVIPKACTLCRRVHAEDFTHRSYGSTCSPNFVTVASTP